MKHFFIFFFVYSFISSEAHAYRASQISITDYEFSHYIRPQLQNISENYYSLVFALDPQIETYKEIAPLYFKMRKYSPKLDISCISIEQLDACRTNLLLIKDLLYSTLMITHKAKMIKGKKSDHLTKFNNYKDHLLGIYSQVYSDALFLNSPAKGVLDIRKTLQEIKYSEQLFNVYLLSLTDLENEFTSFWSEMVHPTIYQILIPNSKETLINKLTQFNKSLHYLVVALTKRNKDLPKRATALANTINLRWRSILKVSLKN